eukprot:TRINITY_DN13484_c1_g1_i6.p1 TRINITY_DN13484_c1_g1~~TRINITY_DN13484_c1_g1_i6.p1  ORF type:complete len:186 (+),score=-11.18 TRINITY_DN13484_c1_g1_i6:505-1062(+)
MARKQTNLNYLDLIQKMHLNSAKIKLFLTAPQYLKQMRTTHSLHVVHIYVVAYCAYLISEIFICKKRQLSYVFICHHTINKKQSQQQQKIQQIIELKIMQTFYYKNADHYFQQNYIIMHEFQHAINQTNLQQQYQYQQKQLQNTNFQYIIAKNNAMHIHPISIQKTIQKQKNCTGFLIIYIFLTI